MLILGIETSCDDTCVAILEFNKNKAKILSNIIYSQDNIHKAYGGVFPNIAIREHKKKIVKAFIKALNEASFLRKNQKKIKKIELKIKEILRDKDLLIEFQEIAKYEKPKIDYLSVTIGPGLDPCLWVGVNFIKALSIYWGIPIIPINHIEGHIFANFISSNFQFPISDFQKLFPAICLVVSGGHTQMILMEKIGKYKILGETRDDAAGECFDKTAKILGLGYPGGSAVAEQAQRHIKDEKNKFNINLPEPMKYQKNYDFSFSGLKTAILYDFKSRTSKIQKNEKYIREICYKAEKAIVDVLFYKTFKAVENYNLKSIILGGGVTANHRLRTIFEEETKIKEISCFFPEKKFSTDNASMIAMVAYFNRNQATKDIIKVKANPNLRLGE